MSITMPELPISEQGLAAVRVAWARALSARFHGMSFTITGTAWRGEWPDDHAHEASRMGLLWLDIADCPRCLEHEFPGWRIARVPGEGYEGTDGERVIRAASRSALVCRLVLAEVRPR